jgi:hypothetical protein
VDEGDLEAGEDFGGEAVEFGFGGLEVQAGGFFDDGVDDVGLAAGGDFAADGGEGLGLGRERGADGDAAGRQFVDGGDFQVARASR